MQIVTAALFIIVETKMPRTQPQSLSVGEWITDSSPSGQWAILGNKKRAVKPQKDLDES